MPVSTELQAIIAAVPTNFADPAADYRAVRSMFAGFHGHPVGDDVEVRVTEFGGIRCGDYRLAKSEPTRVALHCHGGAFVSTPLDEYHFYGGIIARETGCHVIMPDYRLAPEHPHPAAPDDCFNAWRGMLEAGVDPDEVIFFGESCGGSLALCAMLRCRDLGLPLPRAFVSLTGWFDLSVPAADTTGPDPFLDREWVRNRGHDYTGGTVPLDDPAVSPVYADLSGLPHLYLQVGTNDTMGEGAARLAGAARQAGVKVTTETWPDMIHGWHGLVTAGVPEAKEAWQAIRRFVEQV